MSVSGRMVNNNAVSDLRELQEGLQSVQDEVEVGGVFFVFVVMEGCFLRVRDLEGI